MKWIKNREFFLNEAKIRDVINPRQAREVAHVWAEKYLDYEEVEPTDNINQGKWKLSEEDKMKVLSTFLRTDIHELYEEFKKMPEHFIKIINNSVRADKLSALSEEVGVIMSNFDMSNPTIDQIAWFNNSVFRKISINDTRASQIIKKDENGRPIKDDEGNMVMVSKNPGDVVYETNLVNLYGFIDSYNRAYNKDIDLDLDIDRLTNLAKENHNSDFKMDFEIFKKDIYLSINHNASHILNISISKFYSSCQHLYGGGHRDNLLANVFDPNSIPAFLIFDTPIFWGDDKISDFLPLCRVMIRNIETYDESNNSFIYFDRCYPDRMESTMYSVIEKYSKNENTSDSSMFGSSYLFTPDIDSSDTLRSPYMDRLNLNRSLYIGKNTKSITFTQNKDWSNVKISPNAKLKEIIIETENIPYDIFNLKIEADWIKFKYLNIKDFSKFKKLSSKDIAFDRCKIDFNILSDLNTNRIKIICCEIENIDKVVSIDTINEIHLLFTLDGLDELKSILSKLPNLKNLYISTDVMIDKESKDYINELKKNIKVSTIGPKI